MPDSNQTLIDSGKTQYDAGSTVVEGSLFSPARDSFARGSLLLSTYRVESEAIKGGMGAVWRVHHTGWNTDLAMKRPQPRMFADEASKENFIRECQSWIELGLHPNIVSCYYVREIGGVPTIFSEWMENGSLENHIEKGTLYAGTEKEQRARLLDIAIQFARGLHYAHESGLIHQDVKPDNLLLTDDWQAKVADFGLAKARGVLTVKEQIENIGATHVAASGGFTPAYCSMEQMDGKVLTRRTDIYSWAVSVMEMFLGSRPWANGVVAGMSCQEYFDSSRVPLPLELRDLLADCLEMDPDERPHDFGIVEEELLDIYKSQVGTSYPRSRPRNVAGSAEALNNRALSYLDMGMAAQAEKAWRQALKATPNHLDTVYNQGLYEWRQARMTVEEVKQRVSNAQGDQEAKERMLQSVDTEAKQLEPRMIDRGYEKLEWDETCVQGAASPDGRWVYLLRNDMTNNPWQRLHQKNNLDGLFCISPVMVKWRFPQRFRIEIPVGQYRPNFLKLSPDGKYLLFNMGDLRIRAGESTSDDRIHIVDVEQEREEGMLSPLVSAKTACFHPNSRYCYTAEGSIVRKWELSTRQCLKTYELGSAIELKHMRLCVDGAGRRLYCAGPNTIIQMDEDTGEVLFRSDAESISDLCASPDGQTVFSCGGKNVDVWQADGMRKASYPSTKKLCRIWLSPDGNRLLVAAEDGEIQLWDANSRLCQHVFRGQPGPIVSLSASDDLSVILTCGAGKKAYVWSAGTPENNASWEVSRVRSYAEQISQKKESDALEKELRAALRDKKNNRALELLARAESEFDPLRFLPMRRELMACCRRGAFQGVLDLAHFQLGPSAFNKALPAPMCPDPRGGACAFISRPRKKIVFFTEDGKEQTKRAISAADLGRRLAISRSGRYIAASADESVLVFGSDGKLLWTIRGFTPVPWNVEHDYGMEAHERKKCWEAGFGLGSDVKIAISPDEKLLLAGDYNDVGIWSLETGERLYTLEARNDHNDYDCVTDVCFSSTGDRAYVSEISGIVYVYDTRTGARVAIRPLLYGFIFHMHLSPDGKTLYACGEDGILSVDAHKEYFPGYSIGTIYERESGEKFHPYTHNARYDFCLSPDGTMAAECTQEGVKLWSLPDKTLLSQFPALKSSPGDRCLAFSPDSGVLYAQSGQTVYTIVIRRELSFPGWKDWDPAADGYRDDFQRAYPRADVQQAELFLRELQNRGFGYIRPGSAPKTAATEIDDLLADLERKARERRNQ